MILFFVIFVTFIWQRTPNEVSLPAPPPSTNYEIKYNEFKKHYDEAMDMEQQTPSANSSRLLPPYHNLVEAIMVEPKYNLVSCQIEKVMTTIRDGIFCYLTNNTEFLAHNRSISTEYWTSRFCDNTFLRLGVEEVLEEFGPNLTLFTVVRHPIDRFLSGYVDKCINEKGYFPSEKLCFSCGHDLRCFIEKLYKILWEYYMNNTNVHTIIGRDITYYHIRHFAPQTWYCNFKKFKNDYIIVDYHTGTNGTVRIADEFDKIFEQAHVPDDMRAVIHSEMLNQTNAFRRHNTSFDVSFRKAKKNRGTAPFKRIPHEATNANILL
ncbi:hypothetical protein NECAME_01827 [Necator americanus]|uniref:Uncharacterized protein n=1 Tax=Necator americanus TaxID=51031 RepID=W2TMM7_NECAM|nr:hypothetical protein NECAME_01827 [Necator americanus]ETN83028.1 hypothetical protein NECAME_01827 [Necator americanus]